MDRRPHRDAREQHGDGRPTDRPRRAKVKMMAATPTAPRNASTPRANAGGILRAPRTRSPRRVTPKSAPGPTPSRYGSASSLRSNAWKSTPEIAKAAPTSSPRKTCGMRSRRMMSGVLFGSPAPVRASKTSTGLPPALPNMSPTTSASATNPRASSQRRRELTSSLRDAPAARARAARRRGARARRGCADRRARHRRPRRGRAARASRRARAPSACACARAWSPWA